MNILFHRLTAINKTTGKAETCLLQHPFTTFMIASQLCATLDQAMNQQLALHIVQVQDCFLNLLLTAARFVTVMNV